MLFNCRPIFKFSAVVVYLSPFELCYAGLEEGLAIHPASRQGDFHLIVVKVQGGENSYSRVPDYTIGNWHIETAVWIWPVSYYVL